jgi:hypothetical protein
MALYRSTEYSLVAGGKVRVVAWRLTYIPQLVLAIILPVAGLVGRTRRFWPAVGVWEYDPRKSPAIQRLFNGLSAMSLLVLVVVLMLWGIANFMRGTLPHVELGSNREIWFEAGGISCMHVVEQAKPPDEIKHLDLHMKLDGPWFIATGIWTAPYYAIAIAALFLPLMRGMIGHLRKRKKVRRLAMGHCPQCGYDLRMSEERCPECGTAFVRKTVIAMSN